MSERDFKTQLAELRIKLALSKAKVLSDPEPHINKLMGHCSELLKTMEEIEYALSPDIIFDVAMANVMNPCDIQGEALIRCNEALRIIRKYKGAV